LISYLITDLSTSKRASRVAAKFLGDGGAVGLDDQFTQDARVFVLTGKNGQQRCPQVRVAAESVQNMTVKQLVVKQSCSCAVQAVFPALAVTESVRLLQRAVPRMPDRVIHQFNVNVHGNLADVVQQCGVGNDFQSVVKHAARIGVGRWLSEAGNCSIQMRSLICCRIALASGCSLSGVAAPTRL